MRRTKTTAYRNFQIVMILIVGVFISCSHEKVNRSSKLSTDEIRLTAYQPNTPHITFLTFKITLLDSVNDNYEVVLVNQKTVAGNLKKNSQTKAFEYSNNYLYFELSAEKKGTLAVEKVENPLRLAYEYSEENGQPGNVVVTQKTGEFTIRFQYDPSLKYLFLYTKADNPSRLKPIYRATILP